jgi:GNAT superfamily N-acetyltransferase
MIEAVGARTPRNLLQHRDVRRHQKVVDAASGEIVGYARWILPASHSGEWLEAQTPDVDNATRQRLEKQFSETQFKYRDDMNDTDDHVHEWRRKYKSDKSAIGINSSAQLNDNTYDDVDPVRLLTVNVIELDYLSVRPDHHRKGVGSLLLQSGIKAAEDLGLDIFLVAMGGRALGLYLKAGFELLDQKSQDLSPYGEDYVYETFYLIKRAQGMEGGSR